MNSAEAIVPDVTLEQVFTGAGFADVRGASSLQRSITRVARGLPLDGILNDDELTRYYGTTEIPPGLIPTLVVLICGVRGGKSWLAACAAWHATLTAEVSKNKKKLKLHELPRIAVVGPDTDSAAATFTIIRGIGESSPVLSKLIETITSDTIIVKRPDGRRVEICVVAASKGGRTVRNRWLLAFILEEVAQFPSESDGAVVNVDEMLKAARTRLLDGCQGWLISSPYGPQGKLYDLWKRYFGHPGSTLVVWAPTRAMNPNFPQSEIDALAAEDPDTAASEFGAEWTDRENSFLDSVSVDAGIRQGPELLLPPAGSVCACAMDAGTRSNSWTFSVVCATSTRVYVLGCWERKGSKLFPLSPKGIFREFQGVLAPYGIKEIYSDQWSFDANADHANDFGFTLMERDAGECDDGYAKIKTLLGNGELDLPPTPNVRTDLLAMRRRVLNGNVKIILPKQSNGRHCDFCPSISVAVTRAIVAQKNAALGPNLRAFGDSYKPNLAHGQYDGGLGTVRYHSALEM